MTGTVNDKEFLEFVVKALVDNPNEVVVERKVDEMGVLLTLNLNQADMGYVIGRQGQNAKAIRTLLRLVGAKNNAHVNLKINEPEGSTRGRGRDRDQAPREDIADTSAVDDLKI
ncbi:MAG: KH domain-containing protein [Candidatus Kuenenbacteria bacterium]